MRIYFAILMSLVVIVISVFFDYRVNLPKETLNKISGVPSGFGKADIITWMTFINALKKELNDGKLIHSRNAKVSLMATQDFKIQRELTVIGVDPADMDKVLAWLSTRPESLLFEPYRVKFEELKHENFAEGRTAVQYPLRTLVFKSGKFVDMPLYDDEPMGTILDVKKP
jgi:hypothetical protein